MLRYPKLVDYETEILTVNYAKFQGVEVSSEGKKANKINLVENMRTFEKGVYVG